MTNPVFELKKSLLPYYPDMPDEEVNIITQDLINFFTELAEIIDENNNKDNLEFLLNTLKN